MGHTFICVELGTSDENFRQYKECQVLYGDIGMMQSSTTKNNILMPFAIKLLVFSWNTFENISKQIENYY